MSAWTIFLAILVFSVIILFHEFGHFIVAKWNKVKVLEFSLGMGPRLISWVKTSEGRKIMFLKSSAFLEEHPEYNEQTIYSWKLLPFGGSCMMLGEEEDIADDSSFSRKRKKTYISPAVGQQNQRHCISCAARSFPTSDM